MAEEVPQPANPSRFYCPYCGTELPPFGFNFQRASLGLLGPIEYVTIYCGVESCRKILQVTITLFDPTPSGLARLRTPPSHGIS